MNPRLLVVDDEPDLRTLYELTLLREGYDVESAGSVEEAWALLTQRGVGGYQLVITDMRLPDGTGLDLLRRLDDLDRKIDFGGAGREGLHDRLDLRRVDAPHAQVAQLMAGT